MKQTALALLACFALASPIAASGEIVIDAKVSGGIVVLAAKTDGKTVVWIIPESLTQPVPGDAFKDSKTCVCQGKPGMYRVTAISALGDKPIYGDVSFTLTSPEPPPFIPPTPPPLPPIVDDLARRLNDAYLAEMSPAKRGQLVNLTGIYAAMAEHSANDKAIVSSQELCDMLAKVKAGMLMEGVLVEMRRIASAELMAVIGPPSAAPFDRERVSATFSRIVKALPTPK